MELQYLVYALWAALFCAVAWFVYQLILWMKNDKILDLIKAKVSGNMEEASRITMEALQKKLAAERQGLGESKFTLKEKLFRFINQTGLPDKIPGANEVSILVFFLITDALLGLVSGTLAKDPGVGLIITGVYLLALFQIMKTVIGARKQKIDSELLPFINSCLSSASGQTDIISIFQDISDTMDEPLRSMLEFCVAEANATGNKRLAVEHLRDKTASDQFYSAINNLYVCSETSGDYESTIQILSKTIQIYNNNLEKKKSIVRNARANGAVLGILGVVAMGACNMFYDGFLLLVLHSTIGIGLIAAMVVMIIFAMTISVD